MKAYSEDLRSRIIDDSDAGMPTKVVAEKYRVSRAWVRQLKQRRRETGSIAPQKQRSRGPHRKLPIEKLAELESYLREGATTHGWANDLWTIQRVADLIKSKMQIHLSPSSAWNILTKDLGWSSIKPSTVLRERDEAKIAKWRNEQFDEIKWRAQKRGAYLVFADEAGFMLQPTLRKTFAPRGSRPFIRVSDPHDRISTACAITISPKSRRFNLFFQMLSDNRNFNGTAIAAFLKKVRTQVGSPLTVIWDSIPIHSATPVRQYLARQRDVVLEMIPEYAPELNPADGVWAYLKYGRLANYAPTGLNILRRTLQSELTRLRKEQRLLASFVEKTKLSLESW
jgi:transposase